MLIWIYCFAKILSISNPLRSMWESAAQIIATKPWYSKNYTFNSIVTENYQTQTIIWTYGRNVKCLLLDEDSLHCISGFLWETKYFTWHLTWDKLCLFYHLYHYQYIVLCSPFLIGRLEEILSTLFLDKLCLSTIGDDEVTGSVSFELDQDFFKRK